MARGGRACQIVAAAARGREVIDQVVNALARMSARKRSANDAALRSSASSAKSRKKGNVNSVVSSARRACALAFCAPLVPFQPPS